MGRIRTDRVIGFDTEWTCWEDGPPPGMRREIIEIGVVEYDPRTRETLREGRFLVRPAESRVGDYCTSLTGLTQEEVVRHGRPLAEVLRTLAKQFGTLSKPSLAWGDDWGALQGECERLGLGNPFRADGFLNVGLYYGLQAGLERRPGLAAAMEAFGIEPTGTAHRAVDDARNALLVFAAMSEAVAPSPGVAPGPR